MAYVSNDPADALAPVVLPARARQRRVTVAFRLLLALPLLIWIALVSIAFFFAVVCAWFAALLSGRLPRALAGFIDGVINLNLRVQAYLMLLTDEYPAFGLGQTNDQAPAHISLEPPELSRLAVLFRVILMIPGYIVTVLVATGSTLFSPITWLIALVGGQLPAALHDAISASLRYEARFYAYVAMATSAYPRRLFGDPTDLEALSDLKVAGGLGRREPLDTADLTALPRYPFTSSETATTQAGAARPGAERLVLSNAAKALVALFLVLGFAGQALRQGNTHRTPTSSAQRSFDGAPSASPTGAIAPDAPS